jgi:hypothetical protein
MPEEQCSEKVRDGRLKKADQFLLAAELGES